MTHEKSEESLLAAPLGKKSKYLDHYTPSLLFPIPRKIKRDEIQVPEILPFKGYDLWNAFEISWLNPRGKPVVALAEFYFNCESLNIIESKSFKLYLNSFNQSVFESFDQVTEVLKTDLSRACELPVQVRLFSPDEPVQVGNLPGRSIDDLDIECTKYQPSPECLTTSSIKVAESLSSNLLKSNCLVTGQPDWGSVLIQYEGNQIEPEGLLKYIVSFRNHNEFHEQCVERIYMDLFRQCRPEKLTVYARYTRRGGLDINPLRTNQEGVFLSKFPLAHLRLARQ